MRLRLIHFDGDDFQRHSLSLDHQRGARSPARALRFSLTQTAQPVALAIYLSGDRLEQICREEKSGVNMSAIASRERGEDVHHFALSGIYLFLSVAPPAPTI